MDVKEIEMEESFKYHIPEDIPANERTAFHGAAADAAKKGKKNFSFGGKTHPVTMKKDTANKIADQKEADDYHYSTGERVKKKEKKESVKKESTMTFREKLMSLYEGDRAAHYKGATKPEEYDEKQKSSKGAMAMLKTPKSVEADGMKAAKDTADNIKKSAPGKKMRSTDKNVGDLAIKPSATPVKDPSAKVQTMENYGVSGSKVSDSLLKAISVVYEFTHEFDVDSEKNAHSMVKKAKAAGMKAKIHTMKGPGGGNPVIHLGHKDTDHMHKFIKKHYDSSYEKDDLNIHKM